MRGFSLLELSIVLVIIGLIAGSLVIGSDMIHAAELRQLMQQTKEYTTAFSTFRIKYSGIPGDMKNATAYWGAADGGDGRGNDCYNVDSTSSELTCNGDGNKKINGVPLGCNEAFRAWQHLANAGLINGNYSGVTGPGGPCDVLPGTNMPETISNGAFFAYYKSDTTSDTLYFPGDYFEHVFAIGLPDPGNSIPDKSLISAIDMLSVDSKIDDGQPGTGRLITYRNTARPNCSTTDDPITSVYQGTNTKIGCNLIYLPGL